MSDGITDNSLLERDILERDVPEEVLAELLARVKKSPLQIAFKKKSRGVVRL